MMYEALGKERISAARSRKGIDKSWDRRARPIASLRLAGGDTALNATRRGRRWRRHACKMKQARLAEASGARPKGDGRPRPDVRRAVGVPVITTIIPTSTIPPWWSWRWTARAGPPAARNTTRRSRVAASGSRACRAAMAAGRPSTSTTSNTTSTTSRSRITARCSIHRPRTSPRAASRCWRSLARRRRPARRWRNGIAYLRRTQLAEGCGMAAGASNPSTEPGRCYVR